MTRGLYHSADLATIKGDGKEGGLGKDCPGLVGSSEKKCWSG